MSDPELVEHAQALLARNAYLTLGTVDASGRPWTSPVYFAADGLTDFYWVSSPQARHSRNLAEEAAASLVVFDSTVPPYHGRALYAEGAAHEIDADELDRAVQVYPGPPERGGSALTVADVTGAAAWRLYRARARLVWCSARANPGRPARATGAPTTTACWSNPISERPGTRSCGAGGRPAGRRGGPRGASARGWCRRR
ncbi:pyridoxamine 5'-phosphate oxidase family protein [Pseudonocardia sp. CA-107938]|uniref:pyridoxamine 5'-phosphate oxidase family protein n=1 Tax=Pseudonocardia sp. CA-107938 TaxID=3240021 RepID=UPI003D8E7781